MKNELVFYRPHLNPVFVIGSIFCGAYALIESKVFGLRGVWFPSFILLILLSQFLIPMMVLGDRNIKTRGITDPYFRVRLWDDIYKIEALNPENSKKSALLVYASPYDFRKYKMSPDDLRRAIEFIAAKLPPGKCVVTQS